MAWSDFSSDYLYSLMQSIFQEPVEWVSFDTLMIYYTRRNLTYQSDIFRACQGMLRRLAETMGERLIEGLLTPLELSLLFSRQRPVDQSNFRRQGFPSYSWTGWDYIPEWGTDHIQKGPKMGEFWDHVSMIRENAKGTWIEWYQRSSNQKVIKVNDHESEESFMDKTPAGIGECLKDDSPFVSSSVITSHFWKQVPDFAYDILCFSTVSVFLNISLAHPSAKPQPKGRCLAYGLDGSSFGEFILDEIDVDASVIQEFALLSEYRFKWENRVEAGWWGLLLKRAGAVAERRGILRIPMELSDKTLPPGPQWSCIILG